MPLDEADKKTIADLIAASLTGEAHTKLLGEAAAGAVKGLRLEDQVNAAVEKALKARDTAAGAGAGAGAGVGDQAGQAGQAGQGKGKDDATERRIKSLEQQVQDEKKKREDAEQAQRTNALHTAAREALTKAGVPAERMRAAMALVVQDGVLAHDDQGNPVWRGKDKFGADTSLAIEEGAAAWAKTPDGQAFLPPTGAQGDGQGNGGKGGGRRPSSNAPRKADGSVDWSQVAGRIDPSQIG